tara:strand:- start:1316 stop:4798 length:3483 start_codon:yes stop_codon:yes gene_type:complete
MKLDKIIRELGFFVSPLYQVGSSLEDFTKFVDALGYQFGSGGSQGAFDGLHYVNETVSSFFNNTAAEDEEFDLDSILEIFNSFKTLAESGFIKKQGTGNFFEDVLNYLLFRYLSKEKLFIGASLTALGVIERRRITVAGINERFIEVKFLWDRLSLLLKNPASWAKELYGWGGDGNLANEISLDYNLLFNNLALLLESSGAIFAYTEEVDPSSIAGDLSNVPVNATIVRANLPLWQSEFKGSTSDGKPFHQLETGIALLPFGNFAQPTELGITVAPYLRGTLQEKVEISDTIQLEMKATGDLNGSINLVVRPNEITNDTSVGASAGFATKLAFGDFVNNTSLKLIDESAIKMNIINAYLGGGADTNGELHLSAGVTGLLFQFDFTETALLGNFIKEPIDVEIGTLGLSWRYGRGINFEGGNNIEVSLALHIDLGFLLISAGTISVDLEEPSLAVSVNGTLNLAVVKLSVESVGIRASLPLKENGILGNRDISFAFKPPNGIGISVDAGVVKGGGYLYFDYDREEYAGALELVFSEWIALKAVGLITTRLPDGSKGFSMVIIISVEFGSGLQLGFGFTLLGVGGILGINRTVNIDAMSAGVMSGAIESVMFPENVVANAPKIISDLRQFFPALNNQFLIGPMAKIGYGTPTLISLSLGVIIEFPDVNFTILGILKVALPTEEASVIKLQVNFLGRIEPSNNLLWFYAFLFDSRILFITLEGGMGLLVNWGDNSNFVVSVGGFHPRFSPPPLPFPAIPRIAVNILNESMARIRIEGYFAVTSNTVQFGARAELFFGFSAINVQGHLGFDALFQFNPFYFIFEFSLGLSVEVFGFGLFSIDVSGLLEGPAKWHIEGTAKWKITWFGPTIRININETWGEEKQTELPPIEAFPLLEREFAAITNWEAIVPKQSSLLVALRKLGDAESEPDSEDMDTRPLVLHPVGTLRISQRKIPLKLRLDKIGSQQPSDVNEFTVTANLGGGGSLSQNNVREKFARGEFQELDKATKLSSPAFENYESGLTVSADGDALQTSMAVKRVIRYETIIIDNLFKRKAIAFFKQLQLLFSTVFGTLFSHFLKGNAVTRSTLSFKQQKQLQPNKEVIKIIANEYSVAFNDTNKPVDVLAAQFKSQAEATDYLRRQKRVSAKTAQNMHVIPNTEVNTAA